MKNKELLNICYEFFNRFITEDVLIEKLSNIDKSKLSNKDAKEMTKLLDGIKKIEINIPNKNDNNSEFLK